MIAPGAGSSPKRDTYRHGDLRRALIEAGVELARAGGPDAVVLREVTRRVGVAPNAAYRHFADRRALLDAVCAVAWSEMALAMEAEMASVDSVAETDRVSLAKARLGAIATGYVRFAQAEPGMFRTAYSIPADMSGANSPDRVGNSGLTPFQILQSRLDELVEVGLLPAERRPGAEFVTWSAAHGLATLVVDGPLRTLAPEERDDVGRRLLRMVISGL